MELLFSKTRAMEALTSSALWMPRLHCGWRRREKQSPRFSSSTHQLGAIDNPYYSRFEKERYINFSVWSDATKLWEKPGYDEDYPYFFMDRIEDEAATILNAHTYDRFVITGRVDTIFRGKPWIEVVGIAPLPERITEPVLIRMVKAFKFKDNRRYEAAAAEFAQAQIKNLPRNIVAKLHREKGVCLVAAQRNVDALVELEQALAMLPKDEELVKITNHVRDQVARERSLRSRSQGVPVVKKKPVTEKKSSSEPKSDEAKPSKPDAVLTSKKEAPAKEKKVEKKQN